MNQETPETAKAKKPRRSIKSRIHAFLLMAVFVCVGVGLVLLAKNTQQESFLADIWGKAAQKTAELELPGLKPEGEKFAETPLPDHAKAEDMVVVDTGAHPLSDKPQDMALPAADDLSSESAALPAKAVVDSSQVALLQKEISDLQEKIGRLESGIAQSAESQKKGMTRDVALLLAATHLRNVSEKSAPFAESVSMLEKISGDNQDIKNIAAELKKLAGEQTPSSAELALRFEGLSLSLYQQQARIEAESWSAEWGAPEWLQGAIGKVSSLVTIRDGSPSENDTSVDATIMRAHNAMAANDIGQALGYLGKLPENFNGPALSEWKTQAQNRYTIQKDIASIERLLLERIAANAVIN